MTATTAELERAITVLAEAATRQLDFNKQIASAVVKGKQGFPDVETEPVNPVTAQMTEQARKIYAAAELIIKGEDNANGYAKFTVPRLDLPGLDIYRGAQFSDARQAAMDRAMRYPAAIREAAMADPRLREAITTSTSGGAMGVMGAPPIVLIPSDILGNLRDTVQNVDIEQGSQTARFSTMTVPAFGALSQNTEPSDVTQTLTTVDATASEFGAEQNVTYSAQQKFVGDVMAAETQAFRVAAIVHADSQITAALDAATAGNSYTQTIFSDAGVPGSNSEATIDSTDTMSGMMLSRARQLLNSRGIYGNLVAVLDPVQYEALFEDSNLVRFIQTTGQDNQFSTYQATGIIPQYAGMEIRQSTKIVYGTGSGSPAITTRHAYVYQKQVAAGLGLSRDMSIAVQRREWLNSTLIKASIDYAAAVIVPKAIECIITA